MHVSKSGYPFPMKHDIPYYLDYLSPEILARLSQENESVPGVEGLKVSPGLQSEFPEVETPEALALVCRIYKKTRSGLARILAQRGEDRKFVDRRTLECLQVNENIDYLSPNYRTVIGDTDDSGRVVVGPLPESPKIKDSVHVPEFLKGEQITLFGPPDTAKMSINAMNTLHKKLPGEDPLIAELVDASGQVPRWGADNEDSKTPIMRNFLRACENLVGCFRRDLRFVDEKRGRVYELEKERLSIPIKRIPGLALPDGNHVLDGNPLPLHLFDFVLHMFHNWSRKEALVFYVPKLENEEEAAYLRHLIYTTEQEIKSEHPEYQIGSVRLFIVFESPKSIFRIPEMAQALHPYFLGGSLGWHDFLGSTARLFKNDPNYRIPVKADPNIVINHIKESHLILARGLDPIGAIRIGGMYGVLYEDGNPDSFEVSMVGYVKDVITQMKRGLDGFWVAHPSFVRIGIALVEAWRRRERDVSDPSLEDLIAVLVPNLEERVPLLAFVNGKDVDGLEPEDPLYLRGVLAADIEESDVISNNDEEELRYNIFQALQYLTDWLCGNGCVALPAQMRNIRGEGVFVRVMDDLATTERSRWELWAEVRHGRVSLEEFERLLGEELDFIRQDKKTPVKRVQVRWEGEAARWYPIAIRILRQLVLDPEPVEFVPELMLPFTLDFVRDSEDPWDLVCSLCPGRYHENI